MRRSTVVLGLFGLLAFKGAYADVTLEPVALRVGGEYTASRANHFWDPLSYKRPNAVAELDLPKMIVHRQYAVWLAARQGSLPYQRNVGGVGSEHASLTRTDVGINARKIINPDCLFGIRLSGEALCPQEESSILKSLWRKVKAYDVRANIGADLILLPSQSPLACPVQITAEGCYNLGDPGDSLVSVYDQWNVALRVGWELSQQLRPFFTVYYRGHGEQVVAKGRPITRSGGGQLGAEYHWNDYVSVTLQFAYDSQGGVYVKSAARMDVRGGQKLQDRSLQGYLRRHIPYRFLPVLLAQDLVPGENFLFTARVYNAIEQAKVKELSEEMAPYLKKIRQSDASKEELWAFREKIRRHCKKFFIDVGPSIPSVAALLPPTPEKLEEVIAVLEGESRRRNVDRDVLTFALLDRRFRDAEKMGKLISHLDVNIKLIEEKEEISRHDESGRVKGRGASRAESSRGGEHRAASQDRGRSRGRAVSKARYDGNDRSVVSSGRVKGRGASRAKSRKRREHSVEPGSLGRSLPSQSSSTVFTTESEFTPSGSNRFQLLETARRLPVVDKKPTEKWGDKQYKELYALRCALEGQAVSQNIEGASITWAADCAFYIDNMLENGRNKLSKSDNEEFMRLKQELCYHILRDLYYKHGRPGVLNIAVKNSSKPEEKEKTLREHSMETILAEANSVVNSGKYQLDEYHAMCLKWGKLYVSKMKYKRH